MLIFNYLYEKIYQKLLIIALFTVRNFEANAENSIEEVRQNYIKKKYDFAIKMIEILLKSDTKSRDLLLLKSQCMIEQHLYNQALDALLLLKNINPQDAESLFLYAFVEFRLGRYKSAMDHVEQTLLFEPRNKFAYFLKGVIKYEINLHAHAKDYFDIANDISVELSPNITAKKRLVKTFNTIYLVQWRVFESLSSEKIVDHKIWFYKGMLKAVANDNWSALLDFEKAISENKNLHLAHFYRGYTLALIKRYDQALSHLIKFELNTDKKYDCSELINSLKNTLNITNIMYSGESEVPVLVAEVMPKFGNSENTFSLYLATHIKYPEMALLQGIEGTVIVSFIVNTKGELKNIQVLKSIGGDCEKEALRVVNQMPKWKPGSQNGKPVSINMTIPIKFKIQ